MPDFNAKMHQIQFRLELCHRPRWRSLQRFPRSLAGFKGPTSKGREGREGEKDRGGEGRGATPQYFSKVGAYGYSLS